MFVLAGLYRIRPRRAWDELGRIALACTAGTMVLIASVFFTLEVTTSRFIVIAVWIFSIVLVFMVRLVLRVIRHLLLRARIGHRRMVVIGASKAADAVAEEYRGRPILGYTIVKQFAGWNDQTRHRPCP